MVTTEPDEITDWAVPAAAGGVRSGARPPGTGRPGAGAIERWLPPWRDCAGRRLRRGWWTCSCAPSPRRSRSYWRWASSSAPPRPTRPVRRSASVAPPPPGGPGWPIVLREEAGPRCRTSSPVAPGLGATTSAGLPRSALRPLLGAW